MMKRITWFMGGVAAGAAGVGYAKRKIKAQAAKLAPSNVAKGVVDKAKETGRTVASAIRDGREAMKDKEHELRGQLDPEPEGIEARQIVVLENVREFRHPPKPRASHRLRDMDPKSPKGDNPRHT